MAGSGQGMSQLFKSLVGVLMSSFVMTCPNVSPTKFCCSRQQTMLLLLQPSWWKCISHLVQIPVALFKEKGMFVLVPEPTTVVIDYCDDYVMMGCVYNAKSTLDAFLSFMSLINSFVEFKDVSIVQLNKKTYAIMLEVLAKQT
jgi:hypothetical protein